jgi:hypothetical protein
MPENSCLPGCGNPGGGRGILIFRLLFLTIPDYYIVIRGKRKLSLKAAPGWKPPFVFRAAV